MPSIARMLNLTGRTPRLQRLGTRAHAVLYARTGGRIGPRWFGAPVIVLETVGRLSGQRRATPVIYLRDGERIVVLAANAGSDRTPAWFLNLRAAGGGVVRLGRRAVRVRARVTEGPERERLWQAFITQHSHADEYRSFTSRKLPLVVLEPEDGERL